MARATLLGRLILAEPGSESMGVAMTSSNLWSDGSAPAPGVVARRPTRDQVLLRLVRGPGRAWLDLRGLTYLQLPVPDEA